MQKTDWFRIIVDLKKAGVSGRELARRLHVSASAILRWKNGASPDYDDGKQLIDIWISETGKGIDVLPKE